MNREQIFLGIAKGRKREAPSKKKTGIQVFVFKR
jgi:hypothetical protein